VDALVRSRFPAFELAEMAVASGRAVSSKRPNAIGEVASGGGAVAVVNVVVVGDLDTAVWIGDTIGRETPTASLFTDTAAGRQHLVILRSLREHGLISAEGFRRRVQEMDE
jgi:hypothetical protein